jgi:predicted RNase H-like nuclease (RuvC/YqgF family)
MSEWLTGHWTEVVFGTILVLIVRGDSLLRLVKKGRDDERKERDAEVERRLAPMKERAESAERLNSTLRQERDESVKTLQNCLESKRTLEDKVHEQSEQIGKLVSLQPEVFRITGELEALNDRIERLEHKKGVR